jgi:D-alanine--poly(phosphoribitol) ligase subunit 2
MDNTVKEILLRVCGPAALAPDVDLVESGLLDSLATIELLEALEDMGVEIQPTEVGKDAFRSVERIARTVERYRQQKQ